MPTAWNEFFLIFFFLSFTLSSIRSDINIVVQLLFFGKFSMHRNRCWFTYKLLSLNRKKFSHLNEKSITVQKHTQSDTISLYFWLSHWIHYSDFELARLRVWSWKILVFSLVAFFFVAVDKLNVCACMFILAVGARLDDYIENMQNRELTNIDTTPPPLNRWRHSELFDYFRFYSIF